MESRPEFASPWLVGLGPKLMTVIMPYFTPPEPTVRIELTTYSLPWSCSTSELRRHKSIKRSEYLIVVILSNKKIHYADHSILRCFDGMAAIRCLNSTNFGYSEFSLVSCIKVAAANCFFLINISSSIKPTK